MIDIGKFYKTFFKPGNICIDSRNIKPGDVFVSLKGDNFDGNNYAESALANGALVAIIDNAAFNKIDNTLLVDDSLVFLQQLATYHRLNSKFSVISLTGSNGKTTTKELLHNTLSEKFTVQSTVGNLNNHIGVPLTILSIKKETEFAIVEMGANHPNEIKLLCKICLPKSGLITNIGRAHLEGFGGIEGVIRAKAELYDFLKENRGKIYFNASNPTLKELVNNYVQAIPYNSKDGICRGEVLANSPMLKIKLIDKYNKNIVISSNLYGEYNLENLLAAASIAIDLGLNLEEIKNGIEKYFPANNRSQLLKIGSTTFIVDCYNANPSSMQESLLSFSKLTADSKVVILGGMKELGKYSKDEHSKLATITELFGFKEVIFIGHEFKGIKIAGSRYFDSVDELKSYFNIEKYTDTFILIKGSRANKLEKILEFPDVS
jgi:UDP-N-acetylmuramoyl-tripeptide--D-alanyl-D-alanine ligase